MSWLQYNLFNGSTYNCGKLMFLLLLLWVRETKSIEFKSIICPVHEQNAIYGANSDIYYCIF